MEWWGIGAWIVGEACDYMDACESTCVDVVDSREEVLFDDIFKKKTAES